MYIPKHFEELRIDVLHQLIHTHPLATLVTMSSNGLNANHIPLSLQPFPQPLGTLQGHIARANTMLTDIASGSEVLAIFHGAQSYISPSWYATQKETGKVVPTWNYSVVHAYGILKTVDDSKWLHRHLEQFTAQNEAAFSTPWALSDAPQEFTEKLINHIIGIEMQITRLHGKWKVSQNQPQNNRDGVIKGLKQHQNGSDEMLKMIGMFSNVDE
ncbi:MAG: FMN-binding negative transcriptional regulator [Methylococcaceae bacterium]|jgi:transcriptional regulator